MSEANPLVEQVLAGGSPELELLAAQGILPLAPAELIPLQVHLAASPDAHVASCAREALAAVEVHLAGAFLDAEAGAEVLRWFVFEHPDPRLSEAVLRRRDVPRELLEDVAPRLSPDLQEALLLRQDAIVERPTILDALEGNPRLSVYARRRILEYREHLLPREGRGAVEPEVPVAVGELTSEDVAEIERARALPARGDVDERTGLSESQVRALPVPVRIKLTKGASRTLRAILIRDSNRLVALGVLANAAFSEDEIEQVAGNRSLDEEVLGLHLAAPRVGVTLSGLSRAGAQRAHARGHLGAPGQPPVGQGSKVLRKDRNVAEPVRSAAERLYRIKTV